MSSTFKSLARADFIPSTSLSPKIFKSQISKSQEMGTRNQQETGREAEPRLLFLFFILSQISKRLDPPV